MLYGQWLKGLKIWHLCRWRWALWRISVVIWTSVWQNRWPLSPTSWEPRFFSHSSAVSSPRLISQDSKLAFSSLPLSSWSFSSSLPFLFIHNINQFKFLIPFILLSQPSQIILPTSFQVYNLRVSKMKSFLPSQIVIHRIVL